MLSGYLKSSTTPCKTFMRDEARSSYFEVVDNVSTLGIYFLLPNFFFFWRVRDTHG